MQGELEHRRAKSGYKRTSKKNFTKQLAQIERRQSRIKRIRQKLSKEGRLLNRIREDATAKHLDVHHHIGISENQYQDIGSFLRAQAGDPAVKVLPCDIS